MPTEIIRNTNYLKLSKQGRKLVKFDRNGKIYFPALYRKIFRGYRFYLELADGKIVLDPIKLDDGLEEEIK
jgi:hypothetical protein